MADYRLYCYDGAGKIWVADWIEADTDEEAIATARLIKAAMRSEVWHRDRLVATLQAGIASFDQKPPDAESRI